MKRRIIACALLASCCVCMTSAFAGAKTYAGYAIYKGAKSGWFQKVCPDCNGYGCRNCDRTGKVIRWWVVIGVGTLVLGAFVCGKGH